MTVGLITSTHLAGLVLGLGWGAVVATAAEAAMRRRGLRPISPGATDPTRRGPAPAPGRPCGARGHVGGAVTALGAAIRRMATPTSRPAGWPGAPGGLEASRRPHDDPAADRRVGWAALAGGCLLTIAPVLATVPVAWAVAAPVLTARRERARHEATLHDQLPDVVDLLALTAAAGLPVAAALVAIGDRPGGPLGTALARAGAHIRHGGTTGGALERLAAVGPPARPLVDALVQHDRYGTPLLPALARVGIESRARRRRRAEEAARRLPVVLLFPLLLTTFPAFVLLTVVPLLAGSLGSLSLSPT